MKKNDYKPLFPMADTDYLKELWDSVEKANTVKRNKKRVKYSHEINKKKYHIGLKKNNKHIHLFTGESSIPLTQEELNSLIKDLSEMRDKMATITMKSLINPTEK